MIKFDLEKALAGDKVVTRDGQPITQLVKFKTYSGSVLYGLNCDMDKIESWLIDGRYHDVKGECAADLFTAPKKLSGFVNIYRDDGELSLGCLHDDKAMCVANNNIQGKKAIACIDLSQFDEGHGL